MCVPNFCFNLLLLTNRRSTCKILRSECHICMSNKMDWSMAIDLTQRKHNQKKISANALTPTLNFQKTLQHCFLRKTIDFKFVPKAHRNWLRRKTFEANKKWFDFISIERKKRPKCNTNPSLFPSIAWHCNAKAIIVLEVNWCARQKVTLDDGFRWFLFVRTLYSYCCQESCSFYQTYLKNTRIDCHSPTIHTKVCYGCRRFGSQFWM